MEPVTALVLAGGRSTRYGSDKASALVAGRPMLQWVLDAVAPACDSAVIVRAHGQQLPTLDPPLPLTIVEDRYEALGPLAGLVSGFPAVPTPLCFAVACDAPLVQRALIEALVARAPGHDIVAPIVERRMQPLLAVYRPQTCLPVFQDFVERGDLKITAAFGPLRLHTLTEDDVRQSDPELLSFRNANHPQDAAALAPLLEARP